MQLGETPVSKVAEYLKLMKIKEVDPKSFTAEEVINGVIDDFNYLHGEYKSILELADELNDTAKADMV